MTYVEPTLNTIPTEPIGSIPRPLDLLQKLAKLDSEDPALAVALACERGRRRVLKIIRKDLQPNQTVFVGVIMRIHPRIETPEEVRDSVLEACEYIPIDRLGITVSLCQLRQGGCAGHWNLIDECRGMRGVLDSKSSRSTIP